MDLGNGDTLMFTVSEFSLHFLFAPFTEKLISSSWPSELKQQKIDESDDGDEEDEYYDDDEDEWDDDDDDDDDEDWLNDDDDEYDDDYYDDDDYLVRMLPLPFNQLIT